MPATSLADFIAGGLLGVAAGDALGATVEFRSPAEIQRRHGVHRDIVGGGAFGWRPGQGTDDTDLTWAVVAGYLKTGGSDSLEAIAQEFLEWFETDPPDVGITTRQALLNLRHDRDLHRATPRGSAKRRFSALTPPTAGKFLGTSGPPRFKLRERLV
ncbi:ADP-ribosylglycohydrolase family protein [Candidatus Poriferisodalis sp.]|uniref:ADP-ribosylglycohydrolase family protein n=1 Tax=Candidatus Poriferisodalis sp. TaxID=3101277 RepID=UPI003B522B25